MNQAATTLTRTARRMDLVFAIAFGVACLVAQLQHLLLQYGLQHRPLDCCVHGRRNQGLGQRNHRDALPPARMV